MTIEPTTSVNNGRGRPTKLTPEVIAEFEKALASGCYVETAAAYVGVHRDSYYEWLRRGREEKNRVNGGMNGRKVKQKEELYVEFSDTISRALASAEIRDIARIDLAGNEDWRALAWKRERRNPDRWGRAERLEVSGPGGGPVAITLADLAQKASDYVTVDDVKELPEGDEGEVHVNGRGT